MTLLSRKNKIIIAIFLVALVAIGSAFVRLYKEKMYWQERTGYYNYSQWLNLEQMARSIDHYGYTIDVLKEQSPRINSVIYTTTHPLMPSLDGNGKAHSFMGGYYDSLVKDLCSDKLSDEKKSEGLLIFETMNKEFLSLCEYVIDKIGKDDKAKSDLVNNDSKLYSQTQEKIIAFCNKYAEQVSQFTYNAGISSYVIKNIDKEFINENISVLVQYVADYFEYTQVDCIIRINKDEKVLNHLETHIKGAEGIYKYTQGTGHSKNGETQYSLYFEPIGNEKKIELYIELKSGEKITIPLDLN